MDIEKIMNRLEFLNVVMKDHFTILDGSQGFFIQGKRGNVKLHEMDFDFLNKTERFVEQETIV